MTESMREEIMEETLYSLKILSGTTRFSFLHIGSFDSKNPPVGVWVVSAAPGIASLVEDLPRKIPLGHIEENIQKYVELFHITYPDVKHDENGRYIITAVDEEGDVSLYINIDCIGRPCSP